MLGGLKMRIMKYAIFNWIDASIEKFDNEQDAVLEFHRQKAEHLDTRKKYDADARFDKMVIKIYAEYNDIK